MQVSALGRRAVDGVFVGRQAELGRLEALLGEPSPRVLFVHGLAGLGNPRWCSGSGFRPDALARWSSRWTAGRSSRPNRGSSPPWGRPLGSPTVSPKTSVPNDDLDEETRSLVEAAAVVRRVTRSLTASMLPDVDSWKAFNNLRALPFVDVTADGLALHESLQQAIAAQLRAADPSWHRTLRQRAWTHLRRELRHASRSELWRYTADMIYLLENPEVREAHFPSGGHHYAIEPTTSTDAAAIDGIIALHEPPTPPTSCGAGGRAAPRPSGWRVTSRGRSGRHDPRGFADDPVVEGWLQHLRREPIPASQELLLIRRWLTREAGDGPCGAEAACWRALTQVDAP